MISPYSTEKQDKQLKPNPCVPNVNYIRLALVGSPMLCIGSARVLRYQDVGIPNAKGMYLLF